MTKSSQALALVEGALWSFIFAAPVAVLTILWCAP